MFKRGSNKLHTHTFEVYIKKDMKLHGSETAEHIVTVAYVEEIGIVQSCKREEVYFNAQAAEARNDG